MLDGKMVYATIPAKDLQRARAFYEEKLGLKPKEERPDGLMYEGSGGGFLLFPSTGEASGTHTQLGWQVDDLDATVDEMRRNGVVFEEYDLPGFKTVNGIAEIEGERGAWFKDSEGNLLAVGELTT
ncbi:MAG TPA: VOC family protein [Actinomycetota bacterium]|nr:VOC family protein [Actinomycetota bacterium]